MAKRAAPCFHSENTFCPAELPRAKTVPRQKLEHTGGQTHDPVSGHPEPGLSPWDPARSPLLRAGFHTPSNWTLKLPTVCAFGGSNTIKSGSSSSPGLNWLKSEVTGFILCPAAEWDLRARHKWGGGGMVMGYSETRGRTRQIRDLIHQTDNGAPMTKELEAVAGVSRERKSILNFKQSPPRGSLQPPSPGPRLSFPAQVHRN